MYPDEYRTNDYSLQLWNTNIENGDGSVLEAYNDLAQAYQSAQQRISELQATISHLKEKTSRDAELSSLNEQLKTQLHLSNASLKAYRVESVRLKGDLKRLRSSKAVRIGRIISRQLSTIRYIVRSMSTAVSGKIRGAGSKTHSFEQSGRAALEMVDNNSASDADSITLPLSQRSLSRLVDDLRNSPSASKLVQVIHRQWFSHGLIEEPAELLLEYDELLGQFDSKNRNLSNQILGQYRLTQSEIPIPSRAEGAAYTAEPGRIMYCVHSTPIYNSNGYSTRTQGVASGLIDNGEDVIVVARTGYPWDSLVDTERPPEVRSSSSLHGVEYIHVPGPGLGKVAIDHYLLCAADTFVREAKIIRPSVIHAASNFRTALPALIAARRLGVPFVYEVRGLWEITEASEKTNWERTPRYQAMVHLETLVATEADMVLAITSQVADELIKRGVERAKIELAENAVDPDYFVPLPRDVEFAKEKSITTDAPVIGFAGSLVPYEGIELLLEASAVLDSRGVHHQIVVAGSGPAKAELDAKCKRLELRNVLFLGRLSASEMPRLLSTYDILALPRISTAVTNMVAPIKPLEAFSSSKPVVLSNVPPHVDLAGSEGSRALLFPADDPVLLADKLELLIENPEMRAELGRASRLWVVENRSWSNLGREISEHYNLASERHSSSVSISTKLSSLQIALIADEFTSTTLSGSLQTTSLTRDGWREQLDNNSFDLLFVESAWAGNDGEWSRSVGYYGEDEIDDLKQLIDACRVRNVPTVFWNKEDPVHFDRFIQTATLFDHVFTTDANMITEYLDYPRSRNISVSSLPFFAQPQLHNPLPPTKEFESTFAYAGTYYGDRYPTRSRQLHALLDEAAEFDLAIYDRQLALPDSPYRFPPELQQYVRGSLAYHEVIDSYKTHLAHLNVNSVTDSPTMYSRRVVEIAASGGIVLSAPGRGVSDCFGGAIPATNDKTLWRGLLERWASDPEGRLREAWFQQRAVYRAHTIDTAITTVARTAGIAVSAPKLSTYGLVVSTPDRAILDCIARQSVLPSEVFIPCNEDFGLENVRVRDVSELESAESDWLGVLDREVSRTHFEDLLNATRFGDWSSIDYCVKDGRKTARFLAQRNVDPEEFTGLIRRAAINADALNVDILKSPHAPGILLNFPGPSLESPSRLHGCVAKGERRASATRVLVAGHDLKFADSLISSLQLNGATVELDHWKSHSEHDEEKSLALLAESDVVFCEWGLGNAEWYSKRLAVHQRMIVRVHSQELRRPYLRRINSDSVDMFVFVGELIRRAAVESHGIPSEKTIVIPNPVDVGSFQRPKRPDALWTLGLVGTVPLTKRLDRALDLLNLLHKVDTRYKLRIKGKQPSDYPWMVKRTDDMDYYARQQLRIDEINTRVVGSVQYDGFDSDMPSWYQHIGIAISVSDFESFHLTLPEGAASGALPVSLLWPGADLVYPRGWLNVSLKEMAVRILNASPDSESLAATVSDRFGAGKVLDSLVQIILDSPS